MRFNSFYAPITMLQAILRLSQYKSLTRKKKG